MISKKKKEKFLQCLLDDEPENYGYSDKYFAKIKNQRYRARKAAMHFTQKYGIEKLCWNCPLSYRINWDSLTYVTGQSSNEEITNLLRQLVNPDARWIS